MGHGDLLTAKDRAEPELRDPESLQSIPLGQAIANADGMQPTSKSQEGAEAELSRLRLQVCPAFSKLHAVAVLPVEPPQDALHDLIQGGPFLGKGF